MNHETYLNLEVMFCIPELYVLLLKQTSSIELYEISVHILILT